MWFYSFPIQSALYVLIFIDVSLSASLFTFQLYMPLAQDTSSYVLIMRTK